MERIELLGEELIIADTKSEAKQLWLDHPSERHKIWLNRECACHLLDTPEQLQAIIEQKKVKPQPIGCLTGCKFCSNSFSDN